MARGGKGTSAGSGPHTGSGRYGSGGSSDKYDLEDDEDYGTGRDTDITQRHTKSPRNPLTVSREEYNTESYDNMRNRKDILRELYAADECFVSSKTLTVQILLDIREILVAIKRGVTDK